MNNQSRQNGLAVSTVDLQQRIYRIYDHLYANASVRTPAGIANEVGKILHAAMFIEETRNDTAGRTAAFSLPQYQLKRVYQADKPTCREIAAEIRRSFVRMNRAWRLYPKGEEILLADPDVAFSCGQLSDVVVSDPNRDVFGDALEIFRSQWAKKEGGQFFTDQKVTSLAMVLLDFDPRKGDDLVDICAGTGGFLLAGLNRIRSLLEADSVNTSVETDLLQLASSSLKGQEADSAIGEVGNATLRSRLSNAKRPFITIGNSLASDAFLAKKKRISYNTHLCCATNPPFGTKITIKDVNTLSAFELARSQQQSSILALFEHAVKVSSRAPDILFVEQNVKLLKPGFGRLAIVVPYQILSGPQTLYIREWLLRHTEILAVIDLPADTFQPHTGTKASLLVVRRRENPLEHWSMGNDHEIFMSVPKFIGHDRRGNPIYKRNSDGTYDGEILSDFEQVARAFEVFKRGGQPESAHPESFRVHLSDIKLDSDLHLNAVFHRYGRSVQHTIKDTEKWHYKRMSEVVESIFYPTRFKREYVDYYSGAVPFLGGSNISQMIITTDKWLRHDNQYLDTLRVHKGWILITRSGTTGIVSSVPPAWDGFAMSEHVIRIIPNPEKLDPHYLQTFLRTQHAQDIISRGVFGSVIDEITPEYLGEIEVPIPRSEVLLKRVAAKMRKAEVSRNNAIESLTEAVDILTEDFAEGIPAHPDDVAQSAP